MIDSILEHTGIDISNMSENELRETCKSIGVEVE
jgi:lysyl-tRNA synthetase class 2